MREEKGQKGEKMVIEAKKTDEEEKNRLKTGRKQKVENITRENRSASAHRRTRFWYTFAHYSFWEIIKKFINEVHLNFCKAHLWCTN